MSAEDMNLKTPLEPLPCEMLARLERILALARQNRRQYAMQQSGKVAAPPAKAESENPKADARKEVMPAPRRKSRKAAKPYFYNPAQRD